MGFPYSALAMPEASFPVAFEHELQDLFFESAAEVRTREINALGSLLRKHRERCVILGAGNMGRRAVAALRRFGSPPLAMCDSDPSLWGTQIEDLSVLSPAAAAERFGKNAVFFIAVRNEHHSFRETAAQLRGLGCCHVASVACITWRFPEEFLPFLLYDLPHKVYEQAGQVLAAERIWADEVSRTEYLAQVRLRSLGDPSGLALPSAEGSYFLDNVFEVQPGEIFVDCGAFDGDTIRSLIARQPAFGKVEAVEADSLSFAKLARYVAELPPELRSKIRLHPCAVGAQGGRVRFEDSGTLVSRVSDLGDTVVDLVPLDAMFGSRQVSMIKMDIEGGEFNALLGARKVIQRDRPILAICVYHLQQDLWRIPLLIRGMVPDYHMYLKSYGGDGIQTVVFAVPPERVLQS